MRRKKIQNQIELPNKEISAHVPEFVQHPLLDSEESKKKNNSIKYTKSIHVMCFHSKTTVINWEEGRRKKNKKKFIRIEWALCSNLACYLWFKILHFCRRMALETKVNKKLLRTLFWATRNKIKNNHSISECKRRKLFKRKTKTIMTFFLINLLWMNNNKNTHLHGKFSRIKWTTII